MVRPQLQRPALFSKFLVQDLAHLDTGAVRNYDPGAALVEELDEHDSFNHLEREDSKR